MKPKEYKLRLVCESHSKGLNREREIERVVGYVVLILTDLRLTNGVTK